MKTLHVAKAQKVDEKNIESIHIAIDEELPEFENLDEASDKHDFDAMGIAQTLIKTLPGGTLVRVIARLLAYEAGRNFLRIPKI